VDDSEVVLEATRDALENAGFRVITRGQAAGTLSTMLQEKPDLVLLDVNMPRFGGDAIATIFGRVKPDSQTVVLLYSSMSSFELELKVAQTGAHGYIKKTNSRLDLVHQVQYWLKRAQRGALVTPRLSEPTVRESEDLPVSGTFRVGADIESAPSASPLASVSVEPPPASASTPIAHRVSGAMRLEILSVLFVDDDLVTLNGYKRALERRNFVTEFVQTGERALSRILSPSPPNVIVCDVLMPGLNGKDLYKRALASDPSWKYRFVFSTGASTVGFVSDFLRTITSRVLHKPVSTDQLLDAIRYCETSIRLLREQRVPGVKGR
jgi:DNA-binding response OmpR family regulator